MPRRSWPGMVLAVIGDCLMPKFEKSTRGKRALEIRCEPDVARDGYLSRHEKRERFINRGLVSSAVYSSPDTVRGNARAHVHFPKVRPEFQPVTYKRWGDK